MPRLLTLYLTRRIALSVLMIEASLCLPLVMTSLFSALPPAAVRGGLIWPALLGTLPTVLYIALPMAVGIAIALEFYRMASEGMIAVLYSLRLSVWSICLPGIVIAMVCVFFGYFVASFVAPNYVGQMHDVVHVIRNSLNHRMLEPAHFYTFDNGSKTLYFQRWRSSDVVSGMFIHQFSDEKKEEEIITASIAEFRRNENGVMLVLSDGSIESRPEGATAIHTAHFDEYVIPIDMQGTGGMPKRNWRGVFEVPALEFFRERPQQADDPRRFSEWTSEATKRFAVPFLALSHTILAMGLVLTLANATGRSTKAGLTAFIVVPLAHILILIGAETLVRQDPRLVWLVGLAIAAELGVGCYLLYRKNANFLIQRRAATDYQQGAEEYQGA
ncbi:LptF/LptG family permease [Beijerinckia indica]|uniref:Permease-like protein n=1 Tax=Beijerinckia indica subsp. indica (strain ATCC 9039 / DSM 1715 / NCIMB 8712) TaxID=395963 RepID=B2IFN4_BEII9|nr:LptF/LptG family permease [Beijerinckia indica]ACB94245.1 permease-like protein [Beijerinckia indica subsp. indica ATCC 9039]